MTTTEFVKVHDAVSQISKAFQPSFAACGAKQTGGDLLQPAPLSIALLGSLTVISSGTSDFCMSLPSPISQRLFTGKGPGYHPALISENTNTSVKLTYAKYPTSFKTCLQQMVGDGYTAFETASHEMTRINNASSQLPDAIKRDVTILVKSTSPQEVEYLLPTALESVSELTNICVDASRTCETAFVRISSLAQEILECAKIAASKQTTEHNEMYLTILKEQVKQEEKMVEEAKQVSNWMKKSFKDAEQGFKNAVDKVPSGMANRVKGQYLQAGKSGAAGELTQPSGAALSDTGVFLMEQILGLVMSLNHLISGGPDGKPDWDNIRASACVPGLYVKAGLERMQDRLDGTKPISKELLPLVEQAVKVAISINATAASIEGTCDTSLDQHKPVVKKLVEDLQSVVTQCNLILRQTENTATGPGIPSAKNVRNSPSHTQAAIEIAKFRVDQTRANLEVAQDSYDKAMARLIEGIVPGLMQVLEVFTTLRAQFSEMMRLFCNIASLINDVMKPQVSSWVKNIDANSKLVHAGITLSGEHTFVPIYTPSLY
ncbi:hypothetical protein OG21DRAFT_1487701 [Imleria badia]|nr:hypothetical protein OG21DRAFT_1487701 [Imleria badia]